MVELPPNSGTARDSNPRISKNSDGCACGSPSAGDSPIANHVETRAPGSETADTEFHGGCRCNHDQAHARGSETADTEFHGGCRCNHDQAHARSRNHDENGACGHDVAERGCGCNHETQHEHHRDENGACSHDVAEHGCGCGCNHDVAERGCGCNHETQHEHHRDEECGCGGCGCDHDEECGCEDCDGTCDCDGMVDTAWLEEHAPAVDTPTPEEIVELVAACIKFVRDALGFELDLTAETLPILDHYLSAARETLSDRPDLRELVWRCTGAYFGELVRRRYNGFWSLPNADAHTWRINQRQVLMSFNPVGVAAEAIFASAQGEGPTGALRLAHADQEDVAARLAQMPPLPSDEYYLLSTRLEVIDTVIEHLRLRMEQNDQAEIEFDPDDYVNDLAPY